MVLILRFCHAGHWGEFSSVALAKTVASCEPFASTHVA